MPLGRVGASGIELTIPALLVNGCQTILYNSNMMVVYRASMKVGHRAAMTQIAANILQETSNGFIYNASVTARL